jgi:predicted metal-dependent hydrolase
VHIKQSYQRWFEKWEEAIGVEANIVGVKNMLTRWGTCNVKDKRI